MRAGPSLDIEIGSFGVWRAAVLALTGLVCAAMAAWWLAHPVPVPTLISAMAALGVVAALAAALTCWRLPSLALGRRGGLWHLQRGDLSLEPGELIVALDLGGWMLLRFVPDTAGGGARWIPLQRRGLEPQWHALRCAVYAPRSTAPAVPEAGHD
ncbi:MAG: hypothetical protein KDG44_08030 [Burkholderiaceae bacterium]|nr:hypothetical protein [Burkholderiaceae bacterium]